MITIITIIISISSTLYQGVVFDLDARYTSSQMDAGLILDQRRRQWPNIKLAMVEYFVIAQI